MSAESFTRKIGSHSQMPKHGEVCYVSQNVYFNVDVFCLLIVSDKKKYPVPVLLLY